MKHRLSAAVLVVLLVAAGCDGVGPARSDRPRPTSPVAVQEVLDEWASTGPGGVTAALAQVGGEFTFYAAGVAGPDERAMKVDDLFRIGSITKTVVATMLLQLVDEGVLALDEPVTHYAPGLTVAEGVSIRQLLGHASGIPEYITEGLVLEILTDMDRAWTPEEVLLRVVDRPRDFAPGERRAYSSTNYVIAGLLLEEVSGASLADNLRSRIVEPLGLTDTFFPPEAGREPIAGYTPHLPGLPNSVTTDASYRALETVAGAAGALVSTAPDVATYVSALTGGRLLSPETYTAMTQDLDSTGFGLGVQVFLLRSSVIVRPGMRGNITGFDCLWGIVPETDQLFVLLTNDDTRNIDELAVRVFS